jgi:hypothetical protein
MRLLQRATFVWGVALILVPALGVGARPQDSSMALGADVLRAREALNGIWDYNTVESVNAANGRPEQGPRGGARTTGPASQPVPVSAGSGRGRGSGWPGSSGPGSVDTLNPPSSVPNGLGPNRVVRGSGTAGTRALTRDLLEVPVELVVEVLPDAVRVVDDLERERVYRTDDRRAKYQFGASIVEIRTRWDEQTLVKEIEGAGGFRMTETYLASSDGARLFVILRVGEQKKDGPVVGFNRVYDRVER